MPQKRRFVRYFVAAGLTAHFEDIVENVGYIIDVALCVHTPRDGDLFNRKNFEGMVEKLRAGKAITQ